MQQLSFNSDVIDTTTDQDSPIREVFSHEGVCPETARVALEERYAHLLEETDKFNRQLVSFQANKAEVLHSWIKYREGFSADLVEILIEEFGLGPRDVILDPFAGSCTTLVVAMLMDMDAVGIELLPHCHLAWEAKARAFDYRVDELREIREIIEKTTPPPSDRSFPHLYITQSAFPEQTECDLMAYTDWIERLDISEHAKILCRLILLSILEDISYTRKDGQYLRWDGRAHKIRKRNKKRLAQGKKPFKGIDKGRLPGVKEAFIEKLSKIIFDIIKLQRDRLASRDTAMKTPLPSKQELIAGNTLYVLPRTEAEQFQAVITSPPYANRYDYTRTYALELAYLGVREDIFSLRQRQLSCTVENKAKLDKLEEFYHSIDQSNRYARILNLIQNNEALTEINAALQIRNERGEINNTGVLTMIDQYFSELTFIFAELYRTCRRGAYVAFVNDNVRYAGEVIPVDLLSTNLAEQVGFEPIKVYVLPQRKGNSSQQMAKYGRVEMRKSITIWRKPVEGNDCGLK